ncbi:hypothetical protein [Listeria booriae]|uniref:Uncharacterized protein n=1 Tax=Listeria booriae TaxID=1552123 RepID=A0A842EX35_9LIST|nr:hypothetical protein [Listeria booriae]MBC2239755.1 hypothetical protein [Listeria booriae]
MAKEKTPSKDVVIGATTYKLTFSDADIAKFLEQSPLIASKIEGAQSFDESTAVLKESIELFLGEGTFEQVFNDCGNNILSAMSELFTLLEIVNNEIYEDEVIEILPEPEIEEEFFPE